MIISKWPKQIPKLSSAQLKAREEWMLYWHEILPSKYGMIEEFNHGYPASLFSDGYTQQGREKIKTLEVGAGLGEHAAWEDLKNQDYCMLEYRPEWTQILQTKFPDLRVLNGDIQTKLPFEDGHFDRIVAIHVLEHLPDLPAALKEISRLLKKSGELQIVIPCEGGLAYSFARLISSDRLFRKKFKMPYKPIIQAEHLNTAHEILAELAEAGWKTKSQSYFPLKLPIIDINLCLGLCLQKTTSH